MKTFDNDSRLTDARTPTSHAASHEAGGSDEIDVSPTQIVTTSGSVSDVLTIGLSGAEWAPAGTPGAHASTHSAAGTDALTLSASQMSGTAVTQADTGTVTGTMIANTTISSGNLALTLTPFLVPTATILPYSGITTPNGWLLCDGSSVNISTYNSLWLTFGTTFSNATTTNTSTTVSGLSGMSATTHVGWGISGTNIPSGATISSVTNATTVVISTAATGTASGTATILISPYGFTGAGNTSTFLVPDLRGRSPFGRDNMGGSAASRITTASLTNGGNFLGSVGGTQTHTLTTGQMPSHTHTQNAHNHQLKAWNIGTNASWGTFPATGGFASSDMTYNNWDPSQNHITSTTATNQNTGGGEAHQNMPPALILNYIIKT